MPAGKSASIDARKALEQFQDYLAPKLDVYEQAVYLYILRHSRLVGRPRVTVELKSARLHIAKGLGKGGNPIAQRTVLDKLRSLSRKGCVKIAAARQDAPDVRVLLPSEMPGLIEDLGRSAAADLETADFYNVAVHRQLIFDREDGRCFYCRRKLSDSNGAADHVDRRGSDGYRNVVASCRRCNNRKGESSAEDLLRVLFREGSVRSDLLADRLDAIRKLREGRLRPAPIRPT